jgi:hypothetical protein
LKVTSICEFFDLSYVPESIHSSLLTGIVNAGHLIVERAARRYDLGGATFISHVPFPGDLFRQACHLAPVCSACVTVLKMPKTAVFFPAISYS